MAADEAIRQGRYEAALELAGEAEELSVRVQPPTNDDNVALSGLVKVRAQALMSLRRYDEMISLLETQVRADNVAGHYELACAYLAVGRRPEALAQLRRAVSLSPAPEYMLNVALADHFATCDADEVRASIVGVGNRTGAG